MIPLTAAEVERVLRKNGFVRTPCYLIDEVKLERNLKVLASVRKRAGVKILLAQKAFSCYATYPLVAKYLDGTTRLTGPTCLAGDVIGDFSFARRLKVGEEVRFGDFKSRL